MNGGGKGQGDEGVSTLYVEVIAPAPARCGPRLKDLSAEVEV